MKAATQTAQNGEQLSSRGTIAPLSARSHSPPAVKIITPQAIACFNLPRFAQPSRHLR
ncbi:MAG: hypothetical protein KME42_24875 [Tildeniella nuda ZEHNDER 1965/U140]|nr:hypothetical protein [Tildeniella nuda ZEHNDER 1965/U140]